MRRLVFILGLTLWAVLAEAGTYSVNTSTKEDTLIQAEVDKLNQQRGTSLTIQDWVQNAVNTDVKPLKAQDRERENRQACQSFSALSQSAQDAITAQLGGKSPCP